MIGRTNAQGTFVATQTLKRSSAGNSGEAIELIVEWPGRTWYPISYQIDSTDVKDAQLYAINYPYNQTEGNLVFSAVVNGPVTGSITATVVFVEVLYEF